MVEIVSTGISYKTAPVEVRERFSFSDTDLREALGILRSGENVLECCIVSTCNRVEVYAATENCGKCEEEIKSFLLDFHKLPGQSLYPYIHTRVGPDAVRHLFRVAASIDSMVIGETQILNQLKNSYSVARSEDTVGLILNRLFNRAFFAGKKVRAETGISSQAGIDKLSRSGACQKDLREPREPDCHAGGNRGNGRTLRKTSCFQQHKGALRNEQKFPQRGKTFPIPEGQAHQVRGRCSTA